MLTILSLFRLIHDPFEDLLIGAMKDGHADSDTGTTKCFYDN